MKFAGFDMDRTSIPLVRDTAFYASISMLALYSDADEEKKKEYAAYIDTALGRFTAWEKACPSSNGHRKMLIEAEYARVRGEYGQAEEFYERAIILANQGQFINEEGIANELAGRHYLARSKRKIAKTFLLDAYGCYSRWGALPKLTQMKKEYPDMISPATVRPFSGDTQSSGLTLSDTIRAGGRHALDLSTVLKASQTLSGEVVLARLLGKMIHIVMENAGAQKGFVILKDNRKLLVEAYGSIENEKVTVINSVPVSTHTGLSTSIVNFVARTKEVLILNNATEKGDFTHDEYVLKNKPRSILCMPIISQGRLTGLLYLENMISTGAFTKDRVDVLNLLSSQIAISIDNAKLYENLEEKVGQRTEELQAANQQLVEARDALWGEMELAKKIQTVLLPEKPEISGYEILGFMAPADEVGGDYYDIINIEGKDWFIIGDVSGHGVPAGLIMMMVRSSIHAALAVNPDLTPSALLEKINGLIYEDIRMMGESKYMTLMAIASLEDGLFHFSGMHQSILIYRSKKNALEEVESTGAWIGVSKSISGMVPEKSFRMEKGDTMLLYTDGLTEAWKMGPHGKERAAKQMYGEAGLETYIKANIGKSLEEIKKGLLDDLKQYNCSDDVTFVLVRRTDV